MRDNNNFWKNAVDIFITSIMRPANYLSMQNGELSWDKFFSLINCWYKKAWQTCQRYLTFYLYVIYSKKLTVHFNYVPSVLEQELRMGLKCTWCFVTMNFEFIFIYVHFLKAFCHKKSITSCLLPSLSNLYYNIASRATQSNSVTYACSKSRWCTLMAWANRFARIFFSHERPLLAWGKIFRYFVTIMDRNRDSTHQSQNEDNFRPFLLG